MFEQPKTKRVLRVRPRFSFYRDFNLSYAKNLVPYVTEVNIVPKESSNPSKSKQIAFSTGHPMQNHFLQNSFG